jgi:signal transduction histidine kinase
MLAVFKDDENELKWMLSVFMKNYMSTQSQQRSTKYASALLERRSWGVLNWMLLIVFCWNTTAVISAQDTIVLNQKNFEPVGFDSINACEIEDPTSRLQYPQVKNEVFGRFKYAEPSVSFKQLSRQFWTHCVIKNNTRDSLQVYLKNLGHDHLRLYAEFSDGSELFQEAGSDVYMPKRPVPEHKYTFYIHLAPGRFVDCWISTKFIYTSSSAVDVKILSPVFFGAEINKEQTRFAEHRLLGVGFLSITFFLLLFTLFQSWQIQDRMYWYYCCYIAVSFLYFLRKIENFSFFTTPFSYFPSLIEYPETLNALLIHIFYFMFVIEFLDLRKKDVRLYRLLWWMGVICVLYVIGDALVMLYSGSMEYTIVPYMQFRMLLLIPMLYTLYLIAKYHYRPLGRYVFWGSALLIFGASLTLCASLIPNFYRYLVVRDHFFFTYAGVLSECLIFSLGLGYKARVVLEERNKFQGDLLNQLEENQKIESEAKAKMEAELDKRTEEIHRKNKELELLKMEQTRLRIARDLHDEMGSTLSSISIMAESAKRSLKEDVDPTRLDFIGEKTREVMESMSDIVWSVNPENDRFEQVVARMEELMTTLMVAQEIPFNFKIADSIEHVDIPMEKRKDFYLIFKESLNNIVKYAHASKVHVLIETPPGKVRLTVQDNGAGFDPNDIQAGMGGNGLRNMRDRAQLIGADLEITSSKGNGTTIRLEMPL